MGFSIIKQVKTILYLVSKQLLNNSGSVTAAQVLQAVRVLSPYQVELGGLYEQILTLARGLGLQV